ncbi:MAG: hypothetical protein LBD64_05645 [Odoribacteraceae bacterium]|nr:hypothetical protein [Odoribacteraceae bacterium]
MKMNTKHYPLHAASALIRRFVITMPFASTPSLAVMPTRETGCMECFTGNK